MGSTLTVDNIKDSGDNTLVSSTGSGFKMNLSSTAPSSPATGDMYFDTTSNMLKIYNGTYWYDLDMTNTTTFATGGTVQSYASYKSHTFKSDGTLTIAIATTVDMFIVAGGAGGGTQYHGGGGGAGGVKVLTSQTLAIGDYTITVGDGGSIVNGSRSNNAENSSIAGTGFTTITATAGGGGGCYDDGLYVGGNGGSGGGGNGRSSSAAGTGISGQGYAGSPGASYGGGGGGGAGELGGKDQRSTSGIGGSGGAGIQNDYETGHPQWYAGGGGGGAYSGSNPGGIGGQGGGGNGGSDGTGTSFPGLANTGGGGGGWNGYSGTSGGVGGSGIVVIRYAI